MEGYGIKLWSDRGNLAKEAAGIIKSGNFSYVEITVIPGSDIEPFRQEAFPSIIHVAHDSIGASIGEKSALKRNVECFEEAVRWADALGSEKMIIHPGFGAMETAIGFLEDHYDKRLVIENMPSEGIRGERMIGYSPGQIRKLMGAKFGLCLDFGHASAAARSMGIDYKELVREFMRIGPSVFHVADTMKESKVDKHMDFGNGDADIGFMKSCISSIPAPVTLETPLSGNGLSCFLENLNRFRKHD